MPKDIASERAILPGDFYEDCALIPVFVFR